MENLSRMPGRIFETAKAYTEGRTKESINLPDIGKASLLPMKWCPPPIKGEGLGIKALNTFYFVGGMVTGFTASYAAVMAGHAAGS